jgi:aryl-alcohol dehydrogenase-like predicted oxidoreductase
MQIRNLGGSGLRVSAVGLGCNNFGQRTDLAAARPIIHKAIDCGITLFDTADIYARRSPQGHRAGDKIFQTDEQ